MYWQTKAVFSDSRTKHVSAFCGCNLKSFNFKLHSNKSNYQVIKSQKASKFFRNISTRWFKYDRD